MSMEAKFSLVAQRLKQEKDIPARWAWVEPTAWSDRMLAALDNGVKGGKWFSLIDKVWHPANLAAAWNRVRKNRGGSGIDGQSVQGFEVQAEWELSRLHRQLKTGGYVPKPVKRVWIPKPGSREFRPLGVPAVRDRVLQTAVRQVIEPVFEQTFHERSYGFRPGRGCKDALRVVQGLLDEGYGWVVDADLKSYFDTIPHDRLMARVGERISDGRLLALLQAYLDQSIMEGMKEWTPENGTPQGAVISPLLANVYLNPLDHMMAGKGYQMVRYADDFVILCRSQSEAQEALALVAVWVAETGLTLHPEKTRIVSEAEDGFDFLGYRFHRGKRRPRQKSRAKIRTAIREVTKRNNGHSLDAIIAKLNGKLRGWYGYFKHCHADTFERLDGWIRRRLRTILNNRRGIRRWRFTHADHRKWPNAFFQAHGLYSLADAHAVECQPSPPRGPHRRRAGCGKSARPVRREG
jgi:RNA-directed DNA polymerase